MKISENDVKDCLDLIDGALSYEYDIFESLPEIRALIEALWEEVKNG